nr:efflux RND transporter periplasmic adaptor subunit [Geomonas sp. Red32]
MICAAVLALVLVAAFGYRFTHPAAGGGAHAETEEPGHGEGGKEEKGEKKEAPGPATVRMEPGVQLQNGVVVAAAGKERLAAVISATGKVEVNADRVAHVSPRIAGKIVSVHASLGDGVRSGQVLARLDSVELGEALSRYRQSQTRLELARNNMQRVKTLVEKKIAARKEILQAETDYRMAETELHTDRERLLLFGVSPDDLDRAAKGRILLPVRSPIGGVVTEKHAIVGELSDPAKSLYTIADLSSVWVLVDIHEKDLAKVRRGQAVTVMVGAFPGRKFRGRVTYLADAVDEATRTVKARVEVANPGRQLKPEMFATVELAVAAGAQPVLAVPEEAVQELDGKKLVFAARKENEFEPRAVQLGQASGGMVEVVSGLKEGERLAVKGAFILKSELKKGELEGN